MTIGYISSTSNVASSNGSTGVHLALPRPASLLAADTLLLCISSYGFPDIEVPEGFEELANVPNGSGASARNLVIATKKVTMPDNEPATYDTNVSAVTDATAAGRLYQLRNVDTLTKLESITTALSTLNSPDFNALGLGRLGFVIYAGISTSNPTKPSEVTLLNQAVSLAGPVSAPVSRLAVAYLGANTGLAVSTSLPQGATTVGNWSGGTSATGCVVASFCIVPATDGLVVPSVPIHSGLSLGVTL